MSQGNIEKPKIKYPEEGRTREEKEAEEEVSEEKIEETSGEDIKKQKAEIKAQDEEKLAKEREKIKEITGERKKVKPEEFMPELNKTIIKMAEREIKEVGELKEKIEKIKEVLGSAKKASTPGELEQLEKEAGEATKEGERLIGGIGISHAFKERLLVILKGGKIEKEKMIKEESKRLQKEAGVSMKSHEQLKEFFEEQRRRIEEE